MSKATQSFSGAEMTSDGMKFKGIIFQPVVEKCESCGRIREFDGQSYCSSYATPQAKWALGSCNFATHVKMSQGTQGKVNPLKASKRSAKGGRYPLLFRRTHMSIPMGREKEDSLSLPL